MFQVQAGVACFCTVAMAGIVLQGILHPLLYLERAVKVAEPCTGVSGYRSLCHHVGAPWEPIGCYELDAQLAKFWKAAEPRNAASMNLGSQGDVCRIDYRLLGDEKPGGLVAGPPCQPWAPSGKSLGEADCRSTVHDEVLNLICYYAHAGSLLFFLVENSSRLAKTHFLEEALDRLRVTIPWFHVDWIVHDLGDVWPQHRERLWLRGLRKDCLPCGRMPPPLSDPWAEAGVPKITLRNILMTDVPASNPDHMTSTQCANLQVYRKMIAALRLKESFDIAVIELDRNPQKAYRGAVYKDRIPALRTAGPLLFLMSSTDVALGKDWWDMELRRFMTPQERLLIQGHEASLYDHFPSACQAKKAAGNCYNTLQLAVMLAPMLKAAASAGQLHRRVQQEPTSFRDLSQLCVASPAAPSSAHDDSASVSSPEGEHSERHISLQDRIAASATPQNKKRKHNSEALAVSNRISASV